MGKKIMKTILWILLALVILVAGKTGIDYAYRAQDQKKMTKTDEELLGEHFYVPREGKEAVDVNVYLPAERGDAPAPVLFNIHGGAFLAGDADTLDSQCVRLSKIGGCAVVCVNYKLAKGGYTIDYALEEVVDTVKYFREHASDYGIDPERVILLGYSAGGYYAMAAAIDLKSEGIDVAAQVICYGFLKDAAERYAALSEDAQKTIAPALFILAGDEPIGGSSLQYEQALRANGVKTEVKVYEGALHGFIEENNPEYEKLHFHTSMAPEQEVMARDAEEEIFRWLSDITQEN